MRVPAHQAARCGIDQVDVASDQFPEGRFRAVRRVFSDQLLAVRHRLHPVKPRRKPNPNKNIPGWPRLWRAWSGTVTNPNSGAEMLLAGSRSIQARHPIKPKQE